MFKTRASDQNLVVDLDRTVQQETSTIRATEENLLASKLESIMELWVIFKTLAMDFNLASSLENWEQLEMFVTRVISQLHVCFWRDLKAQQGPFATLAMEQTLVICNRGASYGGSLKNLASSCNAGHACMNAGRGLANPLHITSDINNCCNTVSACAWANQATLPGDCQTGGAS